MRKFDDVNGQVVGEVYAFKAFLCYEDRQQCKEQFYKTEKDAMNDMENIRKGIINDIDSRVVDFIYPNKNKWTIRIYEI